MDAEAGVLKAIKKRLATRRNLAAEAVMLMGEVIATHVLRRFKPLAPTVLQLNVNAQCNAKCGMCNIWRTEDKTKLDLEQLDRALSDPLFRSVEYVILSGGEPTLRRDLPDVVRVMLRCMPRLRKISIPTTGIATDRAAAMFPQIARDCLARNVFLSIGISLDGVEGVFEKVRGVPGGYAKAIATLVELKRINRDIDFQLSINPTLSALNVYDVPNLMDVSRKYDVDINFVLVALSESYFNNAGLMGNISFTPEAKAYLERFLRTRIDEAPLLSEMPFYYDKALAMLNGAKREIPCPYQDQGLVLDPSGDMHYCTNGDAIGNVLQQTPSAIYYGAKNLAYRDRVVREVCPTCQISCFVGVGLRKTLFPFLGFTAREFLRRAGRGRRVAPEPERAGSRS